MNKKIRIYPIIVGNLINYNLSIDPKEIILRKIDLEKIENLEEILLVPGTILEIQIKENSKIDYLNFLSSKMNNSAVILKGTNFKINKMSFKETNNKLKI